MRVRTRQFGKALDSRVRFQNAISQPPHGFHRNESLWERPTHLAVKFQTYKRGKWISLSAC